MEAIVAYLGGVDALSRWLGAGTLVGARIAPLLLLAPWLVARTAPIALRTSLGVVLVLVFTPLAMASAPAIPLDPLVLALCASREALVGAIFALATALPFYALDWAGRLGDTWRGASLAEVIAPPTGERTSPLGDLLLMLGVAIFLAIGGHRVALGGLAETFVSLPIGGAGLSSFGAVALGSARLVGQALALSLAIAAPMAVAIVAVEIALGLVARATPQIPVFFAGMPLRAAVGLAALLFSLSLVVERLPRSAAAALSAAAGLIQMLAGP